MRVSARRLPLGSAFLVFRVREPKNTAVNSWPLSPRYCPLQPFGGRDLGEILGRNARSTGHCWCQAMRPKAATCARAWVLAATVVAANCGLVCPDKETQASSTSDNRYTAKVLDSGCGQERVSVVMLSGAVGAEPVRLIRSRYAGSIAVEWRSATQLNVTLVDMSVADAERDVGKAQRRVAGVTITYFLSRDGTVRVIS